MARSEKARRDELRAQLRAKGLRTDQIAAEMGRRWGVRPRTAWRYAMGWDQWRLAQEFMVRNPGARIDESRISRWESWPVAARSSRPSLEALAGLVLVFGPDCTVAHLVDEHDLAAFSPAERDLVGAIRTADTGAAVGGLVTWEPGLNSAGVSDVVAEAANHTARETWAHLVSVTAKIDPRGIQMMHDQIRTLSQAYASTSPAVMLGQARQTRDVAFQMLAQTKHPSQQADLYLAAGMSCALLAGASFDLGQSSAAVAQTQAADRYADLAGHTGLAAWAAGFAGLLAYWDDRPAEAVGMIEAALPHAPAGAATARLEAIRARAWALMGDRKQVTAALAAADDAFGSEGADELHDEIGGELGWESARHEMCAGTALVTAGDAAAAATRLAAVVEQEEAATGVTGRARVDLAIARLAAADLDGAADALVPVWNTPVPQRRFGLTSRLDGLAAALTAGTWSESAAAASMHEQIGGFVAEATEHRTLAAGGAAL
ncbi:hypothetical protein [Antribacter gilvus]|uniref:hypothetical protein n=1 Tax=Antribacter gilvus TaxID=2304675 RepID=UPI000F7A480A|nr:hypothetical protein [Antribacter gilvus]